MKIPQHAERVALAILLSLLPATLSAAVYRNGVSVTSLQAALDAAQPGDVITFDGTQSGPVSSKRSGTASAPITVRGLDSTARIYGSSNTSGFGVTLTHSYYVFEDFTIERFKKGFVGDAAQHVILGGLTVKDIGQEGFKLRNNSQYWLIDSCVAQETGQSNDYGEGFYVGQADSNWINGVPDTSGYVTFIDCIAEDTANDGYDVKEGAHHVKFINCIARWPGGAPTGDATVGRSGWYIRANFIELVNCTVQDHPGDYPGLKIFESTSTGGPYGRNIKIKGYCARNLAGSAIWLHKTSVGQSTTLYSDYSLSNVAGGLYENTTTAVEAAPSTYVQLTWTGTGGSSYAPSGTACSGGVAPPDTTPTITTTSIADTTVGTATTRALGVTGGEAPLTWSISAGALPAGLSLSATTGTISGTPTTAGTASFTARVVDSDGDADTQALTLLVAALPDTTPTITTTSLTAGTVGTAYSATLGVSSGEGSYTWSLSAGALPAGLSLGASNGTLSGTPTAAGTASFTARVVDRDGDADTQALTLTINAAPTGNLRLQYDCDQPLTIGQIKPDLKLINDGTTGIALNRVTIRYWFNNDGRSDVFALRFATVGSSKITNSFGGSGSTRYLQVGFTSTAGTLAAGANTTLKLTVRDQNWVDYDQSNDYSFTSSITSFANYTKIGVYLDGVLVWGTAP